MILKCHKKEWLTALFSAYFYPYIVLPMSPHARMTCDPRACISNNIHYKLWDEITYPFLNFNGATVEVLEWINNIIPHITTGCNYLSMLGLKLNHVSKSGHWWLIEIMALVPLADVITLHVFPLCNVTRISVVRVMADTVLLGKRYFHIMFFKTVSVSKFFSQTRAHWWTYMSDKVSTSH